VAYESVYADEQEEGLLVRCIGWDGGMAASGSGYWPPQEC